MSENAPQTDGRTRVVIEHVAPEVDGGRFPIKRTVGGWVDVAADIFADGHDLVSAVLCYRRAGGAESGQESPMQEIGNDRWGARFQVTAVGRYEYSIVAWIDRFKSWWRDLEKKIEARQDVSQDLLVGAELIDSACGRAPASDAKKLAEVAVKLGLRPSRSAPASEISNLKFEVSKADPSEISNLKFEISKPNDVKLETSKADGSARPALVQQMAELMSRYSERLFAAPYHRWLEVIVDREKARFSAWYEMFPRSAAVEPTRHGTFRDCEARLPYVAEMGFDVLYVPPIHPIGRVHRKGKNNAAVAEPDDVGSPWAIGAIEGGHKSIHPQLGTLEDFRRLVAKCKEFGIEIALDLAFQCSPDHPYVREHPEWFRLRPDGSVQFAENPPKKYEDIYPFDFECDRWQELWAELKSVVLHWIAQGVRIFRVDNPHTKPFGFWEWLIREIKAQHPDVLFLAEAFTRPKVMYRIAKLGFTHSYTYFTWRNTKWELSEYFNELTKTDVREYFRQHLWPNTPDILTENLQVGGRPSFISRLVLAATLAANYGIYGPAFELCENRPLTPGKEEYLHTEKYQIRDWHLESPASLKTLIAKVNRARRENPALQADASLLFHHVGNDQLIAYSKSTEDFSNVILVVVNLDPNWTQSGWVELGLEALRLDPHEPYQVHDLLSDARYIWGGPRNYVELNPRALPAHIFRVRRRTR